MPSPTAITRRLHFYPFQSTMGSRTLPQIITWIKGDHSMVVPTVMMSPRLWL